MDVTMLTDDIIHKISLAMKKAKLEIHILYYKAIAIQAWTGPRAPGF